MPKRDKLENFMSAELDVIPRIKHETADRTHLHEVPVGDLVQSRRSQRGGHSGYASSDMIAKRRNTEFAMQTTTRKNGIERVNPRAEAFLFQAPDLRVTPR